MLIIVVGKSGAGKSAFIKGMDCPNKWYRSSAPIKDEVKRRGMVVSHDTCQIVADDLYNKDIHWQILFILDQLKGKDFLVLDGVRKVAEVRRLFELYPQIFILAIEATISTRFRRLCLRDRISQMDFNRIEQDEAEKTDLSQLLKMADAIVKNNGTLKSLERKAAKFALLFNLRLKK